MGNTCYSSTSGNATVSCNSYSSQNTTLSTAEIVGVAIGSYVLFGITVVIIILIWLFLCRKRDTVQLYQFTNQSHNPQQWTYPLQAPPPYTETAGDFPSPTHYQTPVHGIPPIYPKVA